MFIYFIFCNNKHDVITCTSCIVETCNVIVFYSILLFAIYNVQ